MTGIVKYIVRFILLIFVQVFVLDRIHLHQMITPYLYFLFIIWLPFKMPRMALMLVAFFVGLTMDSFRQHPGFHAAACVLIAYIKPFLANLLPVNKSSKQILFNFEFLLSGTLLLFPVNLFCKIWI